MRPALLFCVFVPFAAFAQEPKSPPVGPPAGMQHVKLGSHTFTLPVGFTIERVAGAPLVSRPIAIDYDDTGALYVSESSGSNEAPSLQLEKKPHRIVKLVDTDGDGKYDTSTVFADKMMLPQGVMWLDGSLYVGAPPQIWKLTDTDGDGVADKRVVWFDGKTLTGCMNDLHGPYRGNDGRIYWTKGAFAKQTYTLPDGKEFTTRAAHIFRAKPDGSQVEPVLTGGMDNPVDIAFLPNGELFFTTTFFQHPANGQRDGIIHGIPGGIYGKDHDVIRDPVHKWSSPQLMPVMTHLGPAAPCGLHCIESAALGEAYRGNLFACQFNLRKVSRHILVPKGASYTTTDSDFLVSDNTDFHPTDVIEDADGSLLVVDTGGWYKLCCPSSQLVKGDVFGGIYRIKPAGFQGKRKPIRAFGSFAKQIAEPLQNLLNETPVNPFLLRHAIERDARESAKRNPQTTKILFEVLKKFPTDRALVHAATLGLIELGDPKELQRALEDKDLTVRRAALMAAEQCGLLTRASDVVIHLQFGDELLRDSAIWIMARHPDWAEDVIDYYRRRLMSRVIPVGEYDDFDRQLAPFLQSKPMQSLLGDLLVAAVPDNTKRYALRSMSRSGVKIVPPAWIDGIDSIVAQPSLSREALTALRSFNLKSVKPELVAKVGTIADSQAPIELQLAAIAALPAGDALNDRRFAILTKHLDRDLPAPLRSLAIEGLSRAKLTPGQLIALTDSFATTGPLEIDRLLELFANASQPDVGTKLIAALKSPKLRTALRVDSVKARLTKFPKEIRDEAESLYALLNAEHGKQQARLDEMVKTLPKGDIRRGQAVFNGQKASCIACHTIGYVGGKTGPDLTRIGGIRTERDLLESVIYPSSSFVRSYEPLSVSLKDGRVFNGLPKKDSPEELILTLAVDKEIRLGRNEIDEIHPGKVSVMPAGLEQQLTPQELADLVAFLKACR
jgi:putative membrane-bound dehydrogenase-like protein